MNGLKSALSEVESVVSRLAALPDGADCLLCPSATLVAAMSGAAGARLKVGGQSCHPQESGAHTGDVSAEQLRDAGASYVIVGHSERRADHGETSEYVAEQALAAKRAGLTPIICVGETLEEREAGDTMKVIAAQLAGSLSDELAGTDFVVAYEPVWAIGTGKVANTDQIGEVHGNIRAALSARFGAQGAATPILYGGSMKPGNAAEILAVEDVNGGLIGGASLKADDFMAIYEIAIA